MAKLKLQLDDLAVESFDTTRSEKARGTVFGEQCTCYTQCTCPGCPTCDGTCPNTCAYTCDDATCAASCNGTCGGSCAGCTYDYTCQGCTDYDVTCRNIGTCNPWAGHCADTP